MRKDAFLHADHEDGRKLEAFGGVERNESDGIGLLVVFVNVGNERDVFEE